MNPAASQEWLSSWGAVAAKAAEAASPGSGTGSLGATALDSSEGPVGRKRGRRPQVLKDLLAAASSTAGPSSSTHAIAPLHRESRQATEAMQALVLPCSSALDLHRPLQGETASGRVALSRLAPALVGARGQAPEGMNAPDEAVQTIADTYLNPFEYHLASGVVLQQLLRIDPPAFQTRLRRLAASMWIHQHYFRQVLERDLVAKIPPQDLIFYVDSSSYDETPLKLRFKDHIGSAADLTSTPELARAFAESSLPDFTKNQTIIAKVLQTRSSFACLVSTSQGLMGLIGDCYHPLQSMSQTTGEVLQECLAKMSCVSPEADRFRLKLRTVCSDKAGYNRRGEELLAAERGPDWSSTLCPCDIHALAACHNKTFDQLFGPDITGLLQWALSLRFAHTLETFRTALSQEIQERLVIVVGQLSPEARQYKQQVLELYVDSRASAVSDMVSLLGACNGDWRRRDVVQFLWSSSENPPPPRSTVLALVVSGVLSVLAASKPSVWPRHRWTGFMRSLSDLSLLDCIHGLLTPAYLRCATLMGKAESKAPSTGGLATGPGGPELSLGDPSTSTGVLPVEFGDLPLHDESETAVLTSEVGLGLESSSKPPNLAQLNAKDRQAAAAWLSSNPQMHILLMSMAAHPLERLMHKHLHLSSEAWQKEMQSEVAAAVLAGRPANSTSRIQIAAKCELETTFLQTLDALFHNPRNWQLFQQEAFTFRFAGLAFRTLSRMGAAVIQLLVHHHQQYPWRLFLLLDNPQLAPELA